MLFRFMIAVAIFFPMIGVWLMENGAASSSIIVPGFETGHENGATWAYAIYALTTISTFIIFLRSKSAYSFGKTAPLQLVEPAKINGKALALLFALLFVMLFGVGGINNYLGATNAGTFRAGLGPIAGVVGGIALKYIAPATFAFMLMTNVAWDKKRVRSIKVLTAGLVMALIGGSYGFKSAFVLALLPAAILYFWNSSKLLVIPLSAAAGVVIFFGYRLFTSIDDMNVVIAKMMDRLFVAQGDVAWYTWDVYKNGGQLPDYSRTLLPMLGDRIASFINGVTIEDQVGWVSNHFSLAASEFSGYSVETIMAGHNNTSTVFTEGLLAGGIPGVIAFAIFAGLVLSYTSRYIVNKLQANDFAKAAVASTYFVNAIMAWLISGGLQVMIHISIPFLLFGTFFILKKVRGPVVAAIAMPTELPREQREIEAVLNVTFVLLLLLALLALVAITLAAR